jgi:hypothetical protein
MADQPKPRWWSMRRAQNLKPATYRCPLCGRHLPALSEHMLLFPEGDRSRRRHAHTECVMSARQAGRLPTREEWLKTQRRPPSVWRRLAERLRRRRQRGGFGT